VDAWVSVPSLAAAVTQAAVVALLGVSSTRPAVLALAVLALGPLLSRVAVLLSCRSERGYCCHACLGRAAPADASVSDVPPSDEEAAAAAAAGVRPWCSLGVLWARTRPGSRLLRALILPSAPDVSTAERWRAAAARLASWGAVSIALLMAAADLRAPRLLFSGLCLRQDVQAVPRERRTAVRAGLAAAEALVAVPWSAAFAVVSVVALLSLEGAACEALSERSARDMAAWMVSAASQATVGIAPSCAFVGEGLWWVGIPCVVGAVVSGLWALTSTLGAVGQRGLQRACARAASPSSARRH